MLSLLGKAFCVHQRASRFGASASAYAPGRPLATTMLMSMMSSAADGHLAVHVKGKLTPGGTSMDTFYRNTLHNARNSILEPGISRFDVLSKTDDPSEFLLIEVYNRAEGPDAHKQTAHYNSWRDGVAALMAQPRAASKYVTLFPPASNWKTDASASTSIGTEDSFMQTLPWTYEPFSAAPATSPLAPANTMLAVVVDVQVTEGSEAAFIAATLANCRSSVKEPGVHRFDLLQVRLAVRGVCVCVRFSRTLAFTLPCSPCRALLCTETEQGRQPQLRASGGVQQ
jgi:hypothetical protein